MSLGEGLRGVNAFLAGWLLMAILGVVINEWRTGNRDRGQYLRFAGLAAYALNSGLAIIDFRTAPVTWHTWLAFISPILSALGVIHIRKRQQALRGHRF